MVVKLLALLLGFASIASIGASGPEADSDSAEQSLALAKAVADRDLGQDMIATGMMELTLSSGLQRKREVTFLRRESSQQTTDSITRFLSPASIAGTTVLTREAEDAVWLFLPALERSRRISGKKQGAKFAQSDLYFEDLQVRAAEEDHHRILRVDDYEGMEAVVLESVPKSADSSSYSKRISWILPEVLIPVRIDFFRRSDQPIKRLEVTHIESIDNIWTVLESTITDLKSGSSTRIVLDSVCFNVGLAEEVFKSHALGRRSQEIECPNA